MRLSKIERRTAAKAVPAHPAAADPVRRLVEGLPRPLRFLGIGGLGLVVDLSVFTVAIGHGANPLLARLVSLAAATLVTWRLNRALTFERSGRRASAESMRYALVAASAQAVSYAVFALLILVLAAQPQLAVVIGAAFATLFSYTGQSLFSLRPLAVAAARHCA